MANVYQTIYQETLKYLINKVGKEYVGDHLKNETNCSPEIKTMNDLFHIFLNAVISTKRMKEAIGPVDHLRDLMQGFDPIKLCSHYGENWELLAAKIKDQQAGTGLKGGSNLENYWAYWEMFCKTALSGACFFSQLKTVKTFKAFVKGFQYNEMTTAVLPLLLQKEISGFTFSSACTFLAEAGFCDYIAPDPKVKSILYDIEMIETKENYELLKTLITIARVNGEKPKRVNKLFWMIAADKLSEQEDKNNNLRNEFINHITSILAKSPQT